MGILDQAFYVCHDKENDMLHYTKIWSLRGSTEIFIAKGGSMLIHGRLASESYEPWISGTNFAFFNNAQFEGKTKKMLLFFQLSLG